MRVIKSMTALVVVAVGMASMAHADSSSALNAQQTKMKTCSADAKTQALTGDARKTFMKSCLSSAGASAPAAKTLTPQQQKMVDCNKQAKAKSLTGADRKTFIATCLKG